MTTLNADPEAFPPTQQLLPPGAALYGLPNGFHPDEKFDYAKYAAINGHVKNYSSYLLRHQEEIFSSPAFQSSVASACNKRNSEKAKKREEYLMRKKKEREEEEEMEKAARELREEVCFFF